MFSATVSLAPLHAFCGQCVWLPAGTVTSSLVHRSTKMKRWENFEWEVSLEYALHQIPLLIGEVDQLALRVGCGLGIKLPSSFQKLSASTRRFHQEFRRRQRDELAKHSTFLKELIEYDILLASLLGYLCATRDWFGEWVHYCGRVTKNHSVPQCRDNPHPPVRARKKLRI